MLSLQIFFGINLGVVPSLTNITIEWLIPLAAGGFALIFCLINNRLSQQELAYIGQ